jgi:hypothetical protein
VAPIVDWREMAGRYVAIHVRANLPGGAGEVDSRIVAHDRLFCERIDYRISDGGSGASAGSTKLDAKLDGTTLYTSNATEDQRPTFAYNATGDDLINTTAVHEVTEFRRGQKLSLDVVSFPTGGAPVWAEATFLCRVP